MLKTCRLRVLCLGCALPGLHAHLLSPLHPRAVHPPCSPSIHASLCSLQYAGNVIVYMRQGGTFQGNWFGGLNPGNADEFLTALFACKVGAAPQGRKGGG